MGLISTSVVLGKTFRGAIETGHWDYSGTAHRHMLGQLDSWLDTLASNLGERLSKRKHSGFSDDVWSPIELTSSNWYDRPAVADANRAQRDQVFEQSVEFSQSIHRTLSSDSDTHIRADAGKSSAMAGFMMMLADQELPRGYDAPYKLAGYQKLVEACQQAGLLCSIMDLKKGGFGSLDANSSPTHFVGVRFNVDSSVWTAGATVSEVGKAILSNNVPVRSTSQTQERKAEIR